MAKRGFSLVELMLVVALSSLILGVVVSLYSFSMIRLAKGAAHFTTEDQARKLVDEIEAVVRDSTNVVVVANPNNPGLKCTLAQLSNRESAKTDTAAGKSSTSADPIGVTKRGYDRHGTGKRVWFYMGNNTGAFGTAGTYLWRAERSDDANPGAPDLYSKFSHYAGTTSQRFPLVTSLTFSVDSVNRTVTVTAVAKSLWRDERSDVAGDVASQTFTETRTIGWRHWFK